MIYTSGSTGEPKGVVVPHRGVIRLVVGTNYVKFGPTDRVAQASTLAFDAATFEIWGALLNGAALVIVPRDTVLSPSKLAARLESGRISTLFLTTALFHHVAKILPEAFRGLRYLVVGGEVLDPLAARAVLRSSGPPDRLLNGYGPTESTTFASWHEVRSEDVAEDSPSVPIGRAISNTRLYVLDPARQPTSVGVAGELWIGGDGLALGYLNRPEFTASRFVTDPFGDGSEPRLYRTGDRVRRLPSGSIEFLGRLDDQLKLRGNRVEPAEIEAALRRQPGVADAAVVPLADGTGNLRLVAYIVPSVPTGLPSNLRSALGAELPSFLVPSEFVVIDRIPLTSGGKVDRRSLPAPSSPSQLDESDQPDAQRDEIAQTVIALWSELFPGRKIGIHDDFFALGGNSLLAIQLFAGVEQVFGSAPPLKTLFMEPTVERFAAALREQSSLDRQASQLFPIGVSKNSQIPPFVCFPGGTNQKGLLLGHGLSLVPLARALGDAYPFFGVSLAEPPHGYSFAEVLPAYANRLLPDLRNAVPHGPYYLGGYSLGGLVALEVARQLLAVGEEVGLLVLFDVFGPNYPRYRGARERLRGHREKMRGLSPIGKVRYIYEKFQEKRIEIKGDRADQEGTKDTLWDSYMTYLNTLPRYPGRITLLRASVQPERVGADHSDSTNGWGAIAEGGVDVIHVPGDHLTMMGEANIAKLAQALRDCINAAATTVKSGLPRVV